MKVCKNSLTFILILLFVTSTLSFSEKRNLSTPLSRLVGHWQTPEGPQWYFGPASSPDMYGSFIRVWPDKETFMKLMEKEKAKGTLSEADIKEAREFIKNVAGMASYCKYKVISQEPNGKKIKIEIYWNDDDPERAGLKNITCYIEKDGIEMKMAVKVPFVDEEFLDEDQAPIKYIDSKTSPEDKK